MNISTLEKTAMILAGEGELLDVFPYENSYNQEEIPLLRQESSTVQQAALFRINHDTFRLSGSEVIDIKERSIVKALVGYESNRIKIERIEILGINRFGHPHLTATLEIKRDHSEFVPLPCKKKPEKFLCEARVEGPLDAQEFLQIPRPGKITPKRVDVAIWSSLATGLAVYSIYTIAQEGLSNRTLLSAIVITNFIARAILRGRK